MRRRSFLAAVWLVLAVGETGLAVSAVLDGEVRGYGYGLIAVSWAGLAGYYWMGDEPCTDPDDPAPRGWYELAGIVTLLFVVVGGVLAVVLP